MCERTSTNKVIGLEYVEVPSASGFSVPQCLSSKHFCLIEEVFADAGYSSGEALKALEENHITGYIPNFGQYKSSREGFRYDKQNDRYTCSRGIHLPFKKLITTSLGYKMKVYRSSAKDCGPCPLRSVCIGKSDFKKIDDSIDNHSMIVCMPDCKQ